MNWLDQKDWMLHRIDWRSCNLPAKVSFLIVQELILASTLSFFFSGKLASTLSSRGLKYFKPSLPETRGNPKYLTCNCENKLVICKARMSYLQVFAMRVEYLNLKLEPVTFPCMILVNASIATTKALTFFKIAQTAINNKWKLRTCNASHNLIYKSCRGPSFQQVHQHKIPANKQKC